MMGIVRFLRAVRWLPAFVLAALAGPGLAFEKIAPPQTAMPTPHGLIFEQMTLAPIRHANGRECWTLHLEYSSRLWESAADTDQARRRVATQLESDIDKVFGDTRRAVVTIGETGVLPEVGAIFVSVDEPGGGPHPYGRFTERAYYIGGGCR